VNRESNFALEIVLTGVSFEKIMNLFLEFLILYVHSFYIFKFVLKFFNLWYRVCLPVEALQSSVWSDLVSGWQWVTAFLTYSGEEGKSSSPEMAVGSSSSLMVERPSSEELSSELC
jgi:hypothetical protein